MIYKVELIMKRMLTGVYLYNILCTRRWCLKNIRKVYFQAPFFVNKNYNIIVYEKDFARLVSKCKVRNYF